MANLYLDEGLVATAVGETVLLTGAEAKHVVSVSRTRTGDELTIGNGRGLLVAGVVTKADVSEACVRVESVTTVARAEPHIVLVQALAKGGRDELAVQAAVELGVDEVVPWQASRSVSRWQGDKLVKGVQRWRAIVREATKQSVRAWLPVVAEPVATSQLAALAGRKRMLVLEPGSSLPLTGIRRESEDDRDIVVVVGPEGGIAPEESRLLTAAGAQSVRLGDSVLRTSSAGPAAIAVLNAALGRW